MRKKMLWILALAMPMILVLSACSITVTTNNADDHTQAVAETPTEQTTAVEETAPSSENASTQPDTAEDWNPYVAQRQILLDENSMLGVVFLGYIEAEATDFTFDHDYYLHFLSESGYADAFDFLMDIPDSRFVGTPLGQELYLLIPYDQDATVTVNSLSYDKSLEAMATDKVLRAFDSGAPFLLKCNYSDIFSDVEIVLTDSDGKQLTWSPMLSLNDGKVVTDAGELTVVDFTRYEAE